MRARGQAEESQIERRSRLAADALDALSGRQIATTENPALVLACAKPTRVLTTTAAQHCPRHRGPPPPTKKITKKTQRLLLMQLLLLLLLRRESTAVSTSTCNFHTPPAARSPEWLKVHPPPPRPSSSARQQHAAAMHDQPARFRCKPTKQLGWPGRCLRLSTELAASAIGRSESRCAVRVADTFSAPKLAEPTSSRLLFARRPVPRLLHDSQAGPARLIVATAADSRTNNRHNDNYRRATRAAPSDPNLADEGWQAFLGQTSARCRKLVNLRLRHAGPECELPTPMPTQCVRAERPHL
ncbi:hypothetical protein L1887_51836 [Cichorium endivia]|nr:hypothetical protein L1887_51836 [Cichorium endivia]